MTSLPVISQPHGTPNQQAAAWELVATSALLFILIIVRLGVWKKFIDPKYPWKYMNFIKSAFTGESEGAHFILYLIVFALVVSATVLQWF